MDISWLAQGVRTRLDQEQLCSGLRVLLAEDGLFHGNHSTFTEFSSQSFPEMDSVCPCLCVARFYRKQQTKAIEIGVQNLIDSIDFIGPIWTQVSYNKKGFSLDDVSHWFLNRRLPKGTFF